MSKHFTLPYEGGLIEQNLPKGILHNYERIWTEIYPESRPASKAVADIVVQSINACEGRLLQCKILKKDAQVISIGQTGQGTGGLGDGKKIISARIGQFLADVPDALRSLHGDLLMIIIDFGHACVSPRSTIRKSILPLFSTAVKPFYWGKIFPG